MNKEQIMTDDDPIEIIHAGDRDDPEPLLRAKPEERLTGGMRPEDIFGLCAEAIDDEFLEIVLANRRGLGRRSRAGE